MVYFLVRQSLVLPTKSPCAWRPWLGWVRILYEWRTHGHYTSGEEHGSAVPYLTRSDNYLFRVLVFLWKKDDSFSSPGPQERHPGAYCSLVPGTGCSSYLCCFDTRPHLTGLGRALTSTYLRCSRFLPPQKQLKQHFLIRIQWLVLKEWDLSLLV